MGDGKDLVPCIGEIFFKIDLNKVYLKDTTLLCSIITKIFAAGFLPEKDRHEFSH